MLSYFVGGRDPTGLVSMVPLSIAGVESEAIEDDYLKLVRLGEVRAAPAHCNNEEAVIGGLLAGCGTTTERPFRDALTGLDPTALLSAGGVSDSDQHVLRTWLGRLPSPRGA